MKVNVNITIPIEYTKIANICRYFSIQFNYSINLTFQLRLNGMNNIRSYMGVTQITFTLV